jgi:Fe-Mn family superoxide dismutase
MSFKLPDLPYPHDALAPYMSRETLEYHHDKHHKAYVDTGNKLLEGSGLEGKSIEEVVKGSFGKNAGLFNNAGQHYNHTHFWQWMKPNGGGDKLPGKLQAKIDSDLGGLAKMKEDFIQAGVTQFGSGWPRRRTARTRSCTAARRSSAAMCGSTRITSITAIAAPTTSRPFSITW